MKKSIFLLAFTFFIMHFLGLKRAYAQTLSFEPSSLGIVQGQKLTVKININTGGQQTSGADALIVFDSNILSIDSVPSNGGFYTNFAANPITGATNKYLISAWEDPGSTNLKSGTGVMATFEFTAKGNGTSAVSFDCTSGSKADSNIIKSDDSDIINCSALSSASYTVGPSNATPITNGTSSNPTALPPTGSVEVTIVAVGAGILLTILGLVFRL